MDKIPESIAGVRLLLPGIVVATIFYLYSYAKFNEVFFIVFCAIFVGLTGLILRVVTKSCSVAWNWLKTTCQRAPGTPSNVGKVRAAERHRSNRGPDNRSPPVDLEGVLETELEAANKTTASSLLFVAEVAIAVVVGLLLVKAYENDAAFRIVNLFMTTEKWSGKDTLDFINDSVGKKDWQSIDQRPSGLKPCKKGTSECAADVYVRIRSKGDGDIYEGAFNYYQSSGERLGMYLSPACVSRRLEQGKYANMKKVLGPGVYVNIAEMPSVEYWELENSECFRLFYPKKVDAPPA